MQKVLNPWYVTGFCDGEAAFTFSRNGGSFGLYFGVKQREDNRQILEQIQDFFGFIGKIYYQKESPPTKNSGFSKPALYYRVNRIKELQRIIEHFDIYPLQSEKKQRAYLVWRKMVMHRFAHYRRINYDELSKLAKELSELNLQSRSFKVHVR